jgi:nucleoside-diphosphate-sugar epimerase
VRVDDVARANVAALCAIAGVRAFNVAAGDPRTVLDRERAVRDGRRRPSVVVVATGSATCATCSSRPARDVLGFAAQVDLGSGMAAFAAQPSVRIQ